MPSPFQLPTPFQLERSLSRLRGFIPAAEPWVRRSLSNTSWSPKAVRRQRRKFAEGQQEERSGKARSSLPAQSQHVGARETPHRSRSQRPPAPSSPPPPVPPGAVEFFATCNPGMEEALASELASLGAICIHPARLGVSFAGRSIEIGLSAVYNLRCAYRVLLRIRSGPLVGQGGGYDRIYRFMRHADDWPSLLKGNKTVSVNAVANSCSDLEGGDKLAAQAARNAILDAVSDSGIGRPPPPAHGVPTDLPLYCSFFQDRAILYRDMGGCSLHRRGYRQPGSSYEAPLTEVAASALLTLAGWGHGGPPGGVLADPMCGTGTLAIEAALMSLRVAPGLMRSSVWRPPAIKWVDVEGGEDRWHACGSRARKAVRDWDPGRTRIIANDIQPSLVKTVEASLQSIAPFVPREMVTVSNTACKEWRLSHSPDIVVCNPPWGQRLASGDVPSDDELDVGGADRYGGASGEAARAWTELGSWLKAEAAPTDAFVLCRDAPGSLHGLHLKLHRKWKVGMGGTDCILHAFRVGAGKNSKGEIANSEVGGHSVE